MALALALALALLLTFALMGKGRLVMVGRVLRVEVEVFSPRPGNGRGGVSPGGVLGTVVLATLGGKLGRLGGVLDGALEASRA